MAEYISGRLRLEAPSGLSDAEIRLLPTMPLHAITTVHGEAGLEQRLLIEIADLPRADQIRVDKTRSLMSLAHACDRRQREPCACYPLRVAIRILSRYRVRDPDVVCAGLLHDTVEEHADDIGVTGSEDERRGMARPARQPTTQTAQRSIWWPAVHPADPALARP